MTAPSNGRSSENDGCRDTHTRFANRAKWITLAALLVAVASPGQESAPPAAWSVVWEATPLITVGAELPGGRLGSIQSLDCPTTGEPIFLWVLAEGKKVDWWPVFWRAGHFERLEKVAAVQAGREVVFVQRAGLSTAARVVEAWSPDGPHRVLGAGDTIDLLGTKHQVRSVHFLSTPSASGMTRDSAILSFTTQGPPKGQGLAVHDGHQLYVVAVEGQGLPGQPGVSVKQVPGMYRLAYGEFPRPRASGGAVFTVLDVAGAPYKQALYRLTRDAADLILALGQPDPLDPTATVSEFLGFVSDRPDRVLVEAHLLWPHTSSVAVFLWERGRLRHLFVGGTRDGTVLLGFPSAELPHALWGVFRLLSETTSENNGIKVTTRHGTYAIMLDDGVKQHDLTPPAKWSVPVVDMDTAPPGFGSTVAVAGEHRGLVVRWAGPEGPVAAAEQQPKLKEEGYFVDLDVRPYTLMPEPQLVTADGRRFPISHIVAWPHPGEVIAWVPDGVYRLRKAAPVSSAGPSPTIIPQP